MLAIGVCVDTLSLEGMGILVSLTFGEETGISVLSRGGSGGADGALKMSEASEGRRLRLTGPELTGSIPPVVGGCVQTISMLCVRIETGSCDR